MAVTAGDMLPSQRVVTKIPLRELWGDERAMRLRRIRQLSKEDVREALRHGSIRFCVADVGHRLVWSQPSESYQFVKDEVLARLVDPGKADAGFSPDDYPGGHAYLASQWQDDSGTHVIVLEKYH